MYEVQDQDTNKLPIKGKINMKHSIKIAAVIALAASAASAAHADYNKSGNYVSPNGTVVITNTRSSYDMGDVVIKQNSGAEIKAGNYTYRQAGDEVVKIRDKDNWTVGTIDFDRNGNVDLNSSILEPTDNGCGVTHRCGGTAPTDITGNTTSVRPINLR